MIQQTELIENVNLILLNFKTRNTIQILKSALLIAKKAKDKKMIEWFNCELNGYYDNNLFFATSRQRPQYRTVECVTLNNNSKKRTPTTFVPLSIKEMDIMMTSNYISYNIYNLEMPIVVTITKQSVDDIVKTVRTNTYNWLIQKANSI